MSKQPKLRPKTHIPGYSDTMCGLSTISSLSHIDSRAVLGEDKPEQRVFRVKRKHVLKACDRCRVKKTKCDGKQPCNRCSAYNHPCLFRERKATQTKVYSRGFVEMLESHHSLVVKALQQLYKICLKNEGFPGEPLVEAPDGYPLTHAILDRLGLIKQAEENVEEPDEDPEDQQRLRFLSSSTDYSATTDPSPEPATPPDPSLKASSPIHLSPKGDNPWKWEFQQVQPVHPETYHSFSHAGGLHGMMSPVDGLLNEVKSLEPLPSSTANQEHPYLYYTDGRSDGDTNTNSRGVATSPRTLPTTSLTGIPVDILENYSSVPLHEPQPMYTTTTLNSGWNYPYG